MKNTKLEDNFDNIVSTLINKGVITRDVNKENAIVITRYLYKTYLDYIVAFPEDGEESFADDLVDACKHELIDRALLKAKRKKLPK